MLESIEQLRKDADKCTRMAGVENKFETVWITKSALLKDIDAIEREVEQNYIELPKDENGEKIHVGDKLHPWNDREEVIEVRAIIDSNAFATYDSEIHFLRCNDPSIWVHYKPPTVEDVLNELCTKAFHSRRPDEHVRYKDVIAEYAQKLQLREE